MAVQGTWGIGNFKIPDLAITEWLFGGSTGKSSWINNPNVYASFGETPQSYANTISTNKLYSDYQSGKGFNPYGPTVTSRKVKGTSTNQLTGGQSQNNQSQNNQPQNDQSVNNQGGQDNYLDQVLNTLRSSLSAIRDFLNEQVGLAHKIKEDSDKYVSGRYDLLKGDVTSKADELLSELGRERENVRSQYAQSEGQTARSYENAALKNRLLARAMGLGPSSYYLQSQMDLREGGLDKLAKLAQERASKFSGISQRETSISDWRTKKLAEIDLEKQRMLDANDAWLKDQVARAKFDQNILGINSYDTLLNALRQYQANKEAIERYNASRMSDLYSTVGQREGIFRADIGSQKAIDSNLSQILSQISALTAGKTPLTPTIGSVTLSQAPTTPYPMIETRRQVNPYEEYLYGLPVNA